MTAMLGCGGGGDAPDAAAPIDAVPADRDAAPECATAADCADGLACNGDETCAEGRCVAGTPMRCDDMVDCTTDFCSEELRRCVNRPTDADGDGVPSDACLDARGMPLGTDCDDAMATIYPGALEVCDAMGVDEDCDPTTRGGLDADGDEFQDARCCNGTGAGACGTDCNDAVRGANPDGTETCNSIDDDCDGMIDEGVLVMGFRDADGDGHGDPSMPMSACGSRAGFSTSNRDCDDTRALRSPSLPEVCDEIDNDCDGTPDPADSTVSALWYEDADGDGFGRADRTVVSCAIPTGSYSLLGTDCNDAAASVNPAQAERCNGQDDDCNGVADFVIAAGDLEDDDRDGRGDARCMPTPTPADCDDRDPASGPGVAESCDGRDNDCDGSVDEMVASFAYFRDEDGDGYGSASSGVLVGCVQPAGYVARGGDCDDRSTVRSPAVTEACNMGVDDDCDGAVDESPSSSECTPMLNQERACVAGRCAAVACLPGYEDCNGSASDGCETMGGC
jgi:hypothetical protein